MAKKSIQEKVRKEFPEFAAEVDALSPDETKNRIVELSRSVEEVKEFLKNDPNIETAKQVVSELTGPSRDTIKALALKIKYLLEVSQ